MPPTQNGNGKSVLITGCSSGIGYCVAQGLSARGYQVFATARRQEDVQRLRQEGLNALLLDLNDSDSIRAAVTEVLTQSDGRLFALFNNGAYGQPGAVEDLSRQALRSQLESNLLGWHELTCLLIPIMRKQGEGRIIQNSSILGLVALPFRGAYVCSKFALEGLTDTLRLELHGSGVHVSLIEPGPIRSRFRDNAFAAYREHIDPQHSVFREKYLGMQRRLEKQGPVQAFTLAPEAVLKKVIHALEHARPRARYYVTFPTHLLGSLRRLLPTRALDWLLRSVSKSENN